MVAAAAAAAKSLAARRRIEYPPGYAYGAAVAPGFPGDSERHIDWLRGCSEAWQAAGRPTPQSWEPTRRLPSLADDWAR
jgi:hypothetical protein